MDAAMCRRDTYQMQDRLSGAPSKFKKGPPANMLRARSLMQMFEENFNRASSVLKYEPNGSVPVHPATRPKSDIGEMAFGFA
jgi:hypothetical protein